MSKDDHNDLRSISDVTSGKPVPDPVDLAIEAAAKRVDPLTVDSGDNFIDALEIIALEDVAGLKKAKESYGNSWKRRGGTGAFMMLARKWDRLENYLPKFAYDIFAALIADRRAEGVIDDIRDLRRYLLLVEAEMRARGFDATHRDNK